MAASDLIIGLGHKKRVGKNAFAEMLGNELEEFGYDVHPVAFAHDMKEMAHDIFSSHGLHDGCFYDAHPEEREKQLSALGKTPRQIWVEFGNAMRAIHPGIWVDRVLAYIESQQSSPRRPVDKPIAFIITDMRFHNEVPAIRSLGGKMIKITRDSAPFGTDPAEVALDKFRGWDHVIANNGSLDALAVKAAYLASLLHYNNVNLKGNQP